MKKTFQKELKSTSAGKSLETHLNGDECSIYSNNTDYPSTSSNHQQLDRKITSDFIGPTPSTTSPSSFKQNEVGFNYSMKSVASGDIESTVGNIVDLEYLKHVIFKFLTSREYEVNI